MRKSRIFGDKELSLLEDRIKGKGTKDDSTGLYSRKVRPKLKEIVDVWIPRKEQLKKAIKKKQRGNK